MKEKKLLKIQPLPKVLRVQAIRSKQLRNIYYCYIQLWTWNLNIKRKIYYWSKWKRRNYSRCNLYQYINNGQNVVKSSEELKTSSFFIACPRREIGFGKGRHTHRAFSFQYFAPRISFLKIPGPWFTIHVWRVLRYTLVENHSEVHLLVGQGYCFFHAFSLDRLMASNKLWDDATFTQSWTRCPDWSLDLYPP